MPICGFIANFQYKFQLKKTYYEIIIRNYRFIPVEPTLLSHQTNKGKKKSRKKRKQTFSREKIKITSTFRRRFLWLLGIRCLKSFLLFFHLVFYRKGSRPWHVILGSRWPPNFRGRRSLFFRGRVCLQAWQFRHIWTEFQKQYYFFPSMIFMRGFFIIFFLRNCFHEGEVSLFTFLINRACLLIVCLHARVRLMRKQN